MRNRFPPNRFPIYSGNVYTCRKINIVKTTVSDLNAYMVLKAHTQIAMSGSKKFIQRGLKFDNVIFLLVDERIIEDPNTIINGPSSARQQNAI